MPHILCICFHCKFALNFQRIDCLHSGQYNLHNCKHSQKHKKRIYPCRIQPCNQLIHKDSWKHWIYDTKQSSNQRNQPSKQHGCPGSFHLFGDKFFHTFLFSVRHKFPGRFHYDTDSGKRLVKFIHRHLNDTFRRVIYHRFIFLKSIQHHKMIEIPVNNTWKYPFCF